MPPSRPSAPGRAAVHRVACECGEHAVYDGFALMHALAVLAVGVAVPGDEVLRGELVDLRVCTAMNCQEPNTEVTESASRCPDVR